MLSSLEESLGFIIDEMPINVSPNCPRLAHLIDLRMSKRAGLQTSHCVDERGNEVLSFARQTVPQQERSVCGKTAFLQQWREVE